jgi:hypothetical protein
LSNVLEQAFSLLFFFKAEIMFLFKPLLLAFLVFSAGFNEHRNKPFISKWVITKGCSLKVDGSTNVNKFTCIIGDYYRPDTLTFYKGSPAEAIRITGVIKLDVQSFDCHNPVMTADLRKTLKSKAFPKLTIQFLNLSRYPVNEQADAVKGAVNIELAGVTKRFEVDYRFKPDGANTATLIGTRKINFSDFNLVPPRKIGGMIQTRNELSVEFNLKVRIMN